MTLDVPRRRLLRVEAPHYVAGSIWEREEGGWRCIEAAFIIRWMVGKSTRQVLPYLKRKGFEYVWLAEFDN